MAASWTISVGGQAFGPYSLEQMKAFHAEKRLAGHSLVAREGEEKTYPAGEDPELAALFFPAAEKPAGKPTGTPQPHRFGARAETDSGDTAPGHFVIVADMKERSITALTDEIYSLGAAHQVGPQAWLLSCQASINIVRTALIQKLGKTDTLFIVDSVNDKVAWFNYGPEADARIRKMWNRHSEHLAGEKRTAIKA
jgi:GYF domain 2